MTLLPILLHLSDYLQMTVFYIVLFIQNRTIISYDRTNRITQWTEQWKMTLNIDKCVILTCSRSTSPPEFQYYINNETLTHISQHLYLGVLFHSSMLFSPHTYQQHYKQCNKDTELCKTQPQRMWSISEICCLPRTSST